MACLRMRDGAPARRPTPQRPSGTRTAIRRRRIRTSPRRPFLGPAGILARLAAVVLLALGGLAAAAILVIAGGYAVLSAGNADPSVLTATHLPSESVVYDRTGSIVLARFGSVRREIVRFDQLAPILADATTAVEDKTFWTNSGYDGPAIVSAVLDSLQGNTRGASTITQQLVRQRLLDSSLVENACGAAAFGTIGIENAFPRWLTADRDWLARASGGAGVAANVGSKEKPTKTAYFDAPYYQPYGASWSPIAPCGPRPFQINIPGLPPIDIPGFIFGGGGGGGHGHGHGHGGG